MRGAGPYEDDGRCLCAWGSEAPGCCFIDRHTHSHSPTLTLTLPLTLTLTLTPTLAPRIDFESVITRGSQYRVESMLMRVAHTQNYLLLSASREQVANQPAMECLPLVMEPESRLHSSPVVVLDFQSLVRGDTRYRLCSIDATGDTCANTAPLDLTGTPYPCRPVPAVAGLPPSNACCMHRHLPQPLPCRSSQYPSMVIAYNLCFSTCIGRPSHYRAEAGVASKEQPLQVGARLGALPRFSGDASATGHVTPRSGSSSTCASLPKHCRHDQSCACRPQLQRPCPSCAAIVPSAVRSAMRSAIAPCRHPQSPPVPWSEVSTLPASSWPPTASPSLRQRSGKGSCPDSSARFSTRASWW